MADAHLASARLQDDDDDDDGDGDDQGKEETSAQKKGKKMAWSVVVELQHPIPGIGLGGTVWGDDATPGRVVVGLDAPGCGDDDDDDNDAGGGRARFSILINVASAFGGNASWLKPTV